MTTPNNMNKPKRIGRTLLGNWVEERSVAHLVSSEQDFKKLSREGHKDLLTQGKDLGPKFSTNHSDFRMAEDHAPKKGPRAKLIEQLLLEQAKLDIQPAEEVHTTNDWKSVMAQDFSKDFVPGDLASPEFSSEERTILLEPISFWSAYLEKHPYIYATNYNDSKPFHRLSKFSCPIEEFKEGPVKDL